MRNGTADCANSQASERWFRKSSFTQSQGKAAHDVIALSLGEVVEERIISESDRLDVIDVPPPRTCLAFVCTSRNCSLTGNFDSNEVIHELISFGNCTISKRGGS